MEQWGKNDLTATNEANILYREKNLNQVFQTIALNHELDTSDFH